ncbi:WhiB family transcriptional regulator [Actinomycetospora chibensis]|uniref:Transcriptional regulator WhiB n=1 Tax=Actinomycetospora chibensis TaxID=663606 RepID=A0ABV9RLC4_9PSEU
MADTNWQVRAACRGVDPELFFPEPSDEPLVRTQVAAAKAVCRRCPVREQCLAEALERLPHGVAGGLTEHERRRARAQRERPGARQPRWLLLLDAGSSYSEVAAEYGVSVRTIARWASRLPSEQSAPTQGADPR